MCVQGLLDGAEHRDHHLRRRLPGAEALHQADQGDEDEEHCPVLYNVCRPYKWVLMYLKFYIF